MDKHIHILRIDSVCPKCGYQNKGEYVLDEPMEIVCCGKCGTILSSPNDMSNDEKSKVISCVRQAIEEEDSDDLL